MRPAPPRAGLVPALLLALLAPASFPPLALAGAPILLEDGATWRYRADGAEPPGWKAPGYDDGAWSSGPAPLGFGDPFIVTPIPMGPNASTRYWTSYFRTRFILSDPPQTVAGLWLDANYDDGFVAYLNGVEIARRSLPSGPITYSTPAALHEAGAFEAINVSAAAVPALVAGENVLAVEVHQATDNSTDLAWDARFRTSGVVRSVTRGPYLQNATPQAITVRWRTNVSSDARVRYGTSPAALDDEAGDATPRTEHEVRVQGLAPGTRYFYSVGTGVGPLAGGDSAHSFVTLPPPGEARPTRIWVIGNSGQSGLAQSRVRDAFYAYAGATPTDVWLLLGDNAGDSGTDAEHTAGLFDPYAEFLRGHCFRPVRGEHDLIHPGSNNDYYDLFTLPTQGEAGGVPSSTEAWYSFDHGDIHFIALDSEGSDRSPTGPMFTWLQDDLAANIRPWVIAFWHHPPYTKGTHDSDTESRLVQMRETAMPILEAHGVDLVLTGHSSVYERSFLLDRHYGYSFQLAPSMLLDDGDGSPAGDGAYHKPTGGQAPHEGTVAIVAGNASQGVGGQLDHPAMFRSLAVRGSVVIDVDGRELRSVFLDESGVVRDSFVVRKGEVVGVPGRPADADFFLRVAGPQPARPGGSVRLAYALPRAAEASLSIVDVAGRRVRVLPGVARSTGPHAATWDGNDASGRRAPAGLYFAVLDTDQARATARIVLVP